MQFEERWGKPLMKNATDTHWLDVTVSIKENEIKLFIVGFVYSIKDEGKGAMLHKEYVRRAQSSPYRPPKGKPTYFDSLETLLNDLEANIQIKK